MAAVSREVGAGEAGDEGGGAQAETAKVRAAVSVVAGDGVEGGKGVAGEGVTVNTPAAFAVTLGSRQPANKSSNGARSVSTSSNTATT